MLKKMVGKTKKNYALSDLADKVSLLIVTLYCWQKSGQA